MLSLLSLKKMYPLFNKFSIHGENIFDLKLKFECHKNA